MYLVTDEHYDHLFAKVGQALDGGVTMVQYRVKETPAEEQWATARLLQVFCENFGVPFIINDNVQLARDLDADGVHLGQGDMSCQAAREILGPEKIIGVTVHDVGEAVAAERAGADYLGAGAVFVTKTKDDAPVLGVAKLAEICSSVQVPVVAIGGITYPRYQLVLRSGAAGAAMVSDILGTRFIKRKVEGYVRQFQTYMNRKNEFE